MFNNVRQLPLTENGKNAWQNKVAKTINSSNVFAGDNIDIDYGPYGATISVTGVDDTPLLQYMGDFDSGSAYYPNQIVRVRPDIIYHDISGAPLVTGTTDVSGYETFPITPGLYVCVAYMPPALCDETWFDESIVPQFEDKSIPISIVAGTRWNSYNVYWPQYPECPLIYTASVTVNGGYNIVANQCFWNALPVGMRAMTSCTNGITQTMWVPSYVSGSQFLEEYLPYQP